MNTTPDLLFLFLLDLLLFTVLFKLTLTRVYHNTNNASINSTKIKPPRTQTSWWVRGFTDEKRKNSTPFQKFKYHASILSCMQVSTYISAGDYQTLADNKPKEFETVPQFMADVLRKKAEFLRQTVGADGAPIVPQHERV